MTATRHLAMPDTNLWPEFSLAWDDQQPGPTDLSYLLEQPAGANGFIHIVDGHLARGDGKRWRIWGQHLVRAQAVPPTHLAPIIARRLAKFGLNCMRLHAIDTHWPDGILMRGTDNSRSIDPEGLARLDWMIACLKQQGIYVDMNLHVARHFSNADGVRQGDAVGWGKPMLYYDDWMITLQKEYARQLLQHRNPFTGKTYAEEPAVALIEITNENCLSEFWQAGWLDGSLERSQANWGDIHKVYADDLDSLWNAWLARKYSRREELAEAWQGDLRELENPGHGSVRRLRPPDFTAASAGRFEDEAAFYSEIEQSFFREMGSFIRGELGAQQLILGSADHNASWSGLPMVKANLALDVTDSHFYWQHPADGKTIENSPMVDQPDRCAVAHLARGAVEGVPHICSEINQPFPNDSAAEFIPILAAYARLQEWDGIIFYDYHPWPGPYWQEQPWKETYQHYWFDMADNPVKMAQTALGALMFLRGDARAARETISRAFPRKQALESLREHGPDAPRPFWRPSLPGRLALLHRTRLTSLEAAELEPQEGEVQMQGGRIVSDTGELTWDDAAENGQVFIDTPRQQAIIGRAGTYTTSNLALTFKTPFAAVQLASLEERSIALAGQLVLVAGTRVANTDQTWADDARQVPADWGKPPIRIEPLEAVLTLHGLVDAQAVDIYPLDDHGQPVGEGTALKKTPQGFELTLGLSSAAPWYLLRVRREK
jgi:hypothetical protein